MSNKNTGHHNKRINARLAHIANKCMSVRLLHTGAVVTFTRFSRGHHRLKGILRERLCFENIFSVPAFSTPSFSFTSACTCIGYCISSSLNVWQNEVDLFVLGFIHCAFALQITDNIEAIHSSDVNKDLSPKAKTRTKD